MKDIDNIIYKYIHCSRVVSNNFKPWIPNEWSHDLEWATGDSLE